MKKCLLTIIIPLFSFVFAGGQSKSNFVLDLGLGISVFRGNHNLSPWGVHYRDNYTHAEPFSFNIMGRYAFRDNMMAGVKYHKIFTVGNYFTDSDTRIAEDITVQYLAPQVGISFPLHPKVLLNINAGLGYLYYSGAGLENAGVYAVFSNMFAGNADFAVDYFFTKHFSLGLNTSFLKNLYSGKLYRSIDGNIDEYMPDKWNELRINNMEFSVNLKIYFTSKDLLRLSLGNNL